MTANVGILGANRSQTAASARPVEPPGTSERRALADLLRLIATESVGVASPEKRAFIQWADAWRPLLLAGEGGLPAGEAPDCEPEPELAATYPQRPDLAVLLVSARQRRRSEAAFVSRTISQVGAAFLEMVLDVRDGLLEDARDDEEIARSVAHLETAIASDDHADLRLRAEHVARIVGRKSAARRKRSEVRMRELGRKMAEHREALVDLETQAAVDQITRLPSRHALEALLERERLISQLSRVPASAVKLGMGSNQTSDRNLVDRVMVALAERLKAALGGTTGYLGRFSGDEFLVVLPNLEEVAAAEQASRWLAALLARPLEHGGRAFKVPLFAGVAECLPEERRDEWVFRADEAMEAARAQGQRRAVRYCEL